jgi:hypothetical protein
MVELICELRNAKLSQVTIDAVRSSAIELTVISKIFTAEY